MGNIVRGKEYVHVLDYTLVERHLQTVFEGKGKMTLTIRYPQRPGEASESNPWRATERAQRSGGDGDQGEEPGFIR